MRQDVVKGGRTVSGLDSRTAGIDPGNSRIADLGPGSRESETDFR